MLWKVFNRESLKFQLNVLNQKFQPDYSHSQVKALDEAPKHSVAAPTWASYETAPTYGKCR